MKPKVIRTKFCEICNKPLRSDAITTLCRIHGVTARNKAYYSLNKEELLKNSKQYRELNREKLKEYDKARNNTISRKMYHKEYERELLKTSPNFRLAKYLRNTVYAAIKTGVKSPKASEFLSCSITEYRKYIESKFTEGMNWENYGEWHIDHIEPLFKFNLQDKSEFLKASHYLNTQPLWKKDNFIKREIDLGRIN